MNIYAFVSNETDWVAAENKKEAIESYKSITGLTNQDLWEYEIIRLTKSERLRLKIINTDEEKDEYGDYPVISNFEEWLKGITSPEIIATTAY